MSNKKIAIFLGSRPEKNKLEPLIKEFDKSNIDYHIVLTGQHSSLLGDVNWDLGKFSHLGFAESYDNRLNDLVARPFKFNLNEYDGVLVQGDTATAFGGALAALHAKKELIHLEAGLRTFDKENPYPEESYRTLISRLADIHFAPTESNKLFLMQENVAGNIYVVGNTGIDALVELPRFSSENKVLCTLHRRENLNLIPEWFTAINNLATAHPELEFVFPLHPNPDLQKHKNILDRVNVIDPVAHNEFTKSLQQSVAVISDSGGAQEECSYFNRRCFVCRVSTERPESLKLTSVLCPTPAVLEDNFNNLLSQSIPPNNCPFGDGKTSQRVAKVLKIYHGY